MLKGLLSSRGSRGLNDGATGEFFGFLYKEGGNNKDFRRRWFVLAGCTISYYADEAAASKGSSKGTFTMTNVGHIHVGSKAAATLEASTIPLCFFMDAEGGRRYICFAESYHDKIAWLRHLTAALGLDCGVARPRLDEQFKERLNPESAAPAWARIAEGIRLGKAGEVAAAQVAFDAAIASTPEDGADATSRSLARYECGRLVLTRANLAEAMQLLQAAAKEPATASWQSLKLQLAWCYGLTDGRREEALELYSKVLDNDLLCCAAFTDRGKLHIRGCEWECALGDFAHVAALGKADANVCNDIGVCHFELSQHEKALMHFTQALELDGKHAPSYSNRANCLRNLGKYADADADYSRAIDIDTTNPKAYLSRALLRESQGQGAAALSDYQRVISLQSQHELALRKVLSLTTDPTEGASYQGWLHKRGHMNTSYQRRYFLLHGAMINYYETADAAKSKGKSKGAPIVFSVAHVRPSHVAELSAEKASRAFRFESTEGKTFIVYAETPEEKNGWLTALAGALGGGHARTRTTVDRAFATQLAAGVEAPAGGSAEGSGGGAVDVSDASRAGTSLGAPKSADAAWALVAQGAKAMKAGNADEARSLLSRAADKSDGPASAACVAAKALLGKLLASKGMYREASEYFAASASFAPAICAQHVKLQLAWACWHSKNGDEKAEAVYWDVLDDDVLCWQALVDRGRMHLGNGAWGRALCDLAQAAAMGKADADVCNDLGVAHYESGDNVSAAHFFSEAIEKNPDHAAALANRANCYKSQGRLREAEEDYTRAIELDGSNAKAFMNRAALLKEQGLTVRAHRDFERALALDPMNLAIQQEVDALAEKLKAAGVADKAVNSAFAEAAGGVGGGRTSVSVVADGALRRERL